MIEKPKKINYVTFDSTLLFIAVFLDRAIGCGNNLAITTVHTLYIDIVNLVLYSKREKKECFEEVVTSRNIRRLKYSVENQFAELEDSNLFKFKFYMLDHIVEYKY